MVLPTDIIRAWRVRWEGGADYWKTTLQIGRGRSYGGTITQAHNDSVDPATLIGRPSVVEDVRKPGGVLW
jgi:hypothetical protein